MADVAGSVLPSQPTVNSLTEKVQKEIAELEKEEQQSANDRKKARHMAKLAIMRDPNLTDEEKIFGVENLDDPTRWTILSKILSGLSIYSIFNTIIFLIIILSLAG